MIASMEIAGARAGKGVERERPTCREIGTAAAEDRISGLQSWNSLSIHDIMNDICGFR
jgi:hypothetical protein